MKKQFFIIVFTLFISNIVYSDSDLEHSINMSKLHDAIKCYDGYIAHMLLKDISKDSYALQQALDHVKDKRKEFEQILVKRERDLSILSKDKDNLIKCKCDSLQVNFLSECKNFVGQIDHIRRAFPELLHQHFLSIAQKEIENRAHEAYEFRKQNILDPISERMRFRGSEIYSRNCEGKKPTTIYEQYQIIKDIEEEIRQHIRSQPDLQKY